MEIIEHKELSEKISEDAIGVFKFRTYDEPWFIASEVGRVLEIGAIHRSVRNLREKDKGCTECLTLGGRQKMNKISEHGLYELIFKSKSKIAKDFSYWIFDEVLPSLRKTGTYTMNQKYLEKTQLLEKTVLKLTTEKAELEDTIANSRYITKNRDHIRISSRLIELGYISRDAYSEVSKGINNLKSYNIKHKDSQKLRNKLVSISKYFQRNSENLFKLNKNRSNYYSEEFWYLRGDNLLADYMEEFPLESWDIDWEYFNNVDDIDEFNEDDDNYNDL